MFNKLREYLKAMFEGDRCKSSKISQEEMQEQALESIRKKELGKYRLVYKKDTRTIIAEPIVKQ